MLRIPRGDKMGMALLFSTDTELDAMTIIRYYKARFQIEFVLSWSAGRAKEVIPWSAYRFQ